MTRITEGDDYGTAPQGDRMVDVLPGGSVTEYPPSDPVRPRITVINGEPAIVPFALRADRLAQDAAKNFRTEK
ncbi:MAG TPA: hypothetical protein VN711_00495 [Candidatus Saccharimonadales bacterium]|nr:hypothetical protein [Candidatus Saccharimonadales bacterium]